MSRELNHNQHLVVNPYFRALHRSMRAEHPQAAKQTSRTNNDENKHNTDVKYGRMVYYSHRFAWKNGVLTFDYGKYKGTAVHLAPGPYLVWVHGKDFSPEVNRIVIEAIFHHGPDHTDQFVKNAVQLFPPPQPVLDYAQWVQRRTLSQEYLRLLPPNWSAVQPNVARHNAQENAWLQIGPSDGIVQISGKAGTGKTQVALHLAVATVVAATEFRDCNLVGQSDPFVLYLHTGQETTATILASRLNQMLVSAEEELSTQQSEKLRKRLLGRIAIHSVTHYTDLLKVFECPLHSSVRLLVIDSLAKLFRGKFFDGTSLQTCSNPHGRYEPVEVSILRSNALLKLADILKGLADERQITVLVLNEVTASTRDGESPNGIVDVPALGSTWAKCVDRSYTLTRREYSNIWFNCASIGYGKVMHDKMHMFRRRMKLLHSRQFHGPHLFAVFRVEKGGVFLENSDKAEPSTK